MGTALTEEHIKLMSRYTKQLVVCMDNDSAGKDATLRSIALLKNSDIEVKVLQLPMRRTEDGTMVKQDPDDYIKHYGGEAFEALLNGSANSVEYRLSVVQGGFDLSRDDQRAQYLLAAAKVVASLPSPVEREIYGNRAADAAGISHTAMAQEVDRLRKRRCWETRKKEEREHLAPARQLQPKDRGLRYTNVRSARAEEGVLRLVLMDSDLFRLLGDLKEEQFSSPLLGRAYGVFRRRWQEGRPVTLAALDGQFSPEETDHLAAVVQEPQPRHTAEAALTDYKQTILAESRRGDIRSGEDLASLRDTLKQKKGYGG